MTGLDIDAIRARHAEAERHIAAGDEVEATIALDAVADDVPLLLAAVERLLGQVEHLRQRLRARVDEVRTLRRDLADAERDVHVLKSTEDVDVAALCSERDQARAALADALQVIADLRGAP